jgi:aminopeptidase-like protein
MVRFRSGLLEDAGIGGEIFALAAEIYPICRSITGDGVRTTLAHLARHIDLEVHEVPSGTRVFDWAIPREWTIRAAWIENAEGERVLDFADCSLHVLNYSRPVRVKLPLEELKKHIFTLPDQPDLIPYRTSYYAENWGFCMAHDRLAALPDGLYEVLIDASLDDGSLTYGEPSVARQRQLLGAGAAHASGRAPRRAEDPLQLPFSLRPRHDRRDRLARSQRASREPHPARAGRLLRRRRRRAHLQEEPPRRRAD